MQQDRLAEADLVLRARGSTRGKQGGQTEGSEATQSP
jgi:hypothetical protein